MNLLIDKELVDLVQNQKFIEFIDPPSDWFSKSSPIQPTSIDMHIGKIFVPETEINRRGGFKNPKIDSHTLSSGETAFIETAEKLNVPKDIAGFGFPPASTAVKGILMTNPGHIDPGFKGHLTFTLINMGKEPFTIRCGDILFSTLWVKLTCNVEKDYSTRTGRLNACASEGNVDVLSKDFLNVNKRAKKHAKSYIKWATIIAASISVLAAGIQYGISNSNANNKRIEEMAKSIAVLEVKLEERNSKKVSEFEKTINSMKSKIDLIERQVAKPKSDQ
jgi:dCTP deaminase